MESAYERGCPWRSDPGHVGGSYTQAGEYVDDYDDGLARARSYRPH
ncbi:hypothetical protein [Rhodococcus aetherivorans]|nr:hypothetical protein [Rhodococcus aetherivorans]MBC2592534.1 hypothetical protein [Rhodococcus aetherivorans]